MFSNSTYLNQEEWKLKMNKLSLSPLTPPSLNPLLMVSPLLLNIKEEKEREGINMQDPKQSMEKKNRRIGIREAFPIWVPRDEGGEEKKMMYSDPLEMVSESTCKEEKEELQ